MSAKKLIVVSLFIFSSVLAFSETNIRTQFKIFNSAYAYNCENGSYWEETRATLTYFEDLIQPYLETYLNDMVTFKAGAGFLIPFNQEQKVINYYPYVQSQFNFGETLLTLGSLDGNHNFPAAILDPLVSITPFVRVLTKTQVPLFYEQHPAGVFSHGFYEYGMSYQWNSDPQAGEIYINWQLPDTDQHRERFDMGLIDTWTLAGLPLYASVHYWHNGGHEHEHEPVWITENYTGAAGLRNTNFNLLYLASLWIPDRDHTEMNVTGGGLFCDYRFILGDWHLIPSLWLSQEFIESSQKYVSVEGDPFYRVPLYFGFIVEHPIIITQEIALNLRFVNGAFLPKPGIAFDWKMIRYDQMIKADVNYAF